MRLLWIIVILIASYIFGTSSDSAQGDECDDTVPAHCDSVRFSGKIGNCECFSCYDNGKAKAICTRDKDKIAILRSMMKDK